MVENYIFTGIGYAHGKHKVTNQDIEKAIQEGWIGDFDPQRIEQLPDYHDYKTEHREGTPLQFFAWKKMGFHTRYHVVSFPPTADAYTNAQSTLDLGVEAVDMAFDRSGIHPEDIDLWLGGCATPFEQAPGIMATVKGHFTHWDNNKPAATINSACVGFNINIERALDYFQTHPEAKHIVVLHTEVMSGMLTNEMSFVPFVTFADAAAAVVLSRTYGDKKEGLTAVKNGEDLHMLDFLGATKAGDLYMGATRVKERATQNIVNMASTMLTDNNWNLDDMDMLVPHQTGHAIVQGASKILGVPNDKLYQEVQLNYGNLSGASVPFSLGKLNDENRLKPGMKLVTAVCGLGGEYGGFSYIVPQKIEKPQKKQSLHGKWCLLTGATGGLGYQIARNLAAEGCNLVLQYNSNEEKVTKIKEELSIYEVQFDIYKCNFGNPLEVADFGNYLFNNFDHFDYVIHTSAITGSLSRATDVGMEETVLGNQINHQSIADVTTKIARKIKTTLLIVGSVAEDALFSGSSTYVSSKRALNEFARGIAKPLHKQGVKTIYYKLGLLNAGMVDKLDKKQQVGAMMSIGQKRLLPANEVAKRIVRSIYRPKVLNLEHSWDGDLIVRRDGYKWNNE